MKKIFVKMQKKLLNKKKMNEYKDPEEVMRFLKKFKEPRDEIDRAFKQYKVQKFAYKYWRRNLIDGILNIACFFPLIYILMTKDRNINSYKIHYGKCCVLDINNKDIVPESLKREFSSLEYISTGELLITKDVKKKVREIWKRYPFSFELALKCALKLGYYNKIMREYSPEAIVNTTERSYTTSVVNKFCNERGVQQFSIQHGEITLSGMIGFFTVNRMYVWDEFYKNLCIEMRAEPEAIIIEYPFSRRTANNENKPKYKYKYYLQNETKESLEEIKRLLQKLNGSFLVRPHPIFSDMKILNKVFEEDELESVSIDIFKSMDEAGNVIGKFSTVLSQAAIIGKPIIIDNVSDAQIIKKLEKWNHILTTKKYSTLKEELERQRALGINDIDKK